MNTWISFLFFLFGVSLLGCTQTEENKSPNEFSQSPTWTDRSSLENGTKKRQEKYAEIPKASVQEGEIAPIAVNEERPKTKEVSQEKKEESLGENRRTPSQNFEGEKEVFSGVNRVSPSTNSQEMKTYPNTGHPEGNETTFTREEKSSTDGNKGEEREDGATKPPTQEKTTSDAQAEKTVAPVEMKGRTVLEKRDVGNLNLKITGLRNDKGNVRILLFDRPEGFPSDHGKALRMAIFPIQNRAARGNFENLPSGAYAISVLHDENDNKKLDTNFFGVPREGTGASNDARGFLGPPKFKDARFDLTQEDREMVISIQY